MKTSQRIKAALLSLLMMAGLLMPSNPAVAATENDMVLSTPTVGEDFAGYLNTIIIKEKGESSFSAGDTFTVTLPDGVEFAHDDDLDGEWESVTSAVYAGNHVSDSSASAVDFSKTEFIDERTLLVTMGTSPDDSSEESIKVELYVIVDDVVGDIKVDIDSMGSGVTDEQITVGRVGSGTATVEVTSVKSLADTTNETGGQIKIDEVSPGSLKTGEIIELKLSSGFKWNAPSTTLDEVGLNATATIVSDRELQIEITGQTTRQPGTIYITPNISTESDADYGDVEVTVSGADIDKTTVVIGTYSDYGVEVTAEEDVPNLYFGTIDNEVADFYIEESAKGSLIENRKIVLELPNGFAKFNEVPEIKVVSGDAEVSDFSIVDANHYKAEAVVTDASTKPAKIRIRCKNINFANFALGDLKLKVYGSALDGEETLVLAKVLPPIDFSANTDVKQAKPLIIGAQGQAGKDIILKENFAGAIKKDTDVLAPYLKPGCNIININIHEIKGVTFSELPKVEVIEGDLKLKDLKFISSPLTGEDDKQWLSVEVERESTEPSTIKISNLKYTVDRTVPEGTVVDVRLKSIAIINSFFVGSKVDNPGFAATGATIGLSAIVVTPAPTTLLSATFENGSTIYTADGIKKAMDAAPYIKDGRTYLPVRYLAQALGVKEENIKYQDNVVTIVKGNDTLKLTFGDKNLDINGSSSVMDVAPEISSGRTMLPARFVAEGLGAKVYYEKGKTVISMN